MIDTTDAARPKRVHVRPHTQDLHYHREAALLSPKEFAALFRRQPTSGARWEWVAAAELVGHGWQKGDEGWWRGNLFLPHGQSEKGVMVEIDHSRP